MTFKRSCFGWLPLAALVLTVMLPPDDAVAEDRKGKAAKKQAKNRTAKAEKSAKVVKGDDDLHAIWSGLQGLVADGKMSKADAVKIMTSIKQVVFAPDKKHAGKHDNSKTGAYLIQAWDKLQASVARKELSARDAEAKMIAIKKKLQSKDEQAALDAYFHQVWAKLQAAVKANKMTKEDAAAKMAAIKKAKLGGK